MTARIAWMMGALKTISEANARDHWSVKHRRTRRLRRDVCLLTAARCYPLPAWCAGPVTVTLTRLAPGILDTDNLAAAMKAVRDGIADALRRDDGDPAIEWRYAQQRTARGTYAVEVVVEQRMLPPPKLEQPSRVARNGRNVHGAAKKGATL